MYVVTRMEFDTATGEAMAQLATLVEVEDDMSDNEGGSIIRLRCEFSEV